MRAPTTLAILVLVPLLAGGPLAAHTDMTPEEVYDRIAAGGNVLVLDVREYSEFCATWSEHIANAVSMPWISGVLNARFAELPTDWEIIIVCASGARSNNAANFLDAQGFTDVFDMTGGMNAWIWETEGCTDQPLVMVERGEGTTEIDWVPWSGEPQDYDLLRGDGGTLADAGTHVDLGTTDCLVETTPFSWHSDADPVSTDSFLYYLVRPTQRIFGQSSGGLDRITTAPGCD